jgi:aspartate racemase
MKIAGIVGGVGPESTIDYYRFILERYRNVTKDVHNPRLLIHSVDVNTLLEFMKANRLADVTEYLLAAVEVLARGGADFAAIAANTPHIVFDEVQARSPLPLVSIVEATRDAARERGLRRLGLLGTRFTMQARFYPEVFARTGLEIVVPTPAEQDVVHDIYLGELLQGTFLAATKDLVLALVDRMAAENGIDAVILGGTELPLLLRMEAHHGIPFIDTTQVHAARIVAAILE